MGRAWAVVVAALEVGACVGAGRALLALLLGGLRHVPKGVPGAALMVAAGVVVLGNVGMALAWLGLLQPAPLVFMLAVPWVGALWRVEAWRVSRVVLPGWLLPPVLLGVGLPLLVCSIPTGFYDALVYHLAIPKAYLDAGRMVDVPWSAYASFPMVLELASLPAVAWDQSGVAAALVVAVVGLCGVVGTWMVAARLAGLHAAAGAVLVAACAPLLVQVRTIQSNDAAAAAMGVLAVWCLFRARTRQRWFLVAAWLAGGAVCAKSSAALQVLPVLMVLALGMPGALAGRMVRAAALPVVGLLMNLPTYIHNALDTGNPFFPAFTGVLGGRGWGAQEAAFLQQDVQQVAWNLDGLRLVPETLLAVFMPLDGRFQGALCLLGVVLSVASRTARHWLWMPAMALVLWSVSFPQARFLAFSVMLASVAGGAALAAAARHPGARRTVLGAAVAAALVLDGQRAWDGWGFWQGHWWQAAAGLTDPAEYQGALLDYPLATAAAEAFLPQGSHLLMLGDARCHPAPVPCEAASILDTPPLYAFLHTHPSPPEVAAWLKARNVGVVLLRPGEMSRLAAYAPHWRLPDEEREVLVETLRTHARLVMATPANKSLLFALEP